MHRLGSPISKVSAWTANAEEAARWFTQAAQLGLMDSQFDLAVLYERGMGVDAEPARCL